MNEEKTYTIKIMCNNCQYGHSYSEYKEVNKGTTAKNFIANKTCPRCGCKTIIEKY